MSRHAAAAVTCGEVIRLTADDDLGFSGLLASGKTPQEAWDLLHERCSDPSVRAAMEVLRRTPQGPAAFDRLREAWAAYGLPPPWEDPGAIRIDHRFTGPKAGSGPGAS